MNRIRALGINSIALLALVAGCDSGVVPDDQLVYTLVAVDNLPLPADIGAAVGVSTKIRTGQLLGSPSDDRCEYHIQYERANGFSNIEGPVYNCVVEKGGQLLVRIDVGQLVGSHEFLFQH